MICTATTSGDIVIKNVTPDPDYPPNSLGRETNDLDDTLATFKVLVRSEPALSDRTLTTARKIEQIDGLFAGIFETTELDSANEVTIVYEVIRGSGLLYTAANATKRTTLSAHENLDVYLDMNGTSNEVAAYVLGNTRVERDN